MELGYALAVSVTILASILVVRRLDRRRWHLGRTLRRRLILGLPWGTFLAVGVIVLVYLLVQDAVTDLTDPVTLPFRAWSYGYPTGWLTAAFAHNSFDHFLGNLTSALVLGALAEFAYGHYPHRRGSVSFGSWRTNPYVRAFVIFPGAVIAVGITTALFALGPVIGFSGVVFAFAGYSLVRYPLTTVVAVFGFRAVRRFIEAIRHPDFVVGISAPPPSPPWWAEVAIQGHALGLLLGVGIGLAVFKRRDAIPSAWRIWLAVLLFGIAQSLWAVYWFEGTDRFRLLQGFGVVLVLILAGIVAAAATSSDRELVGDITRRQLAVGILVIGLALVAGPSVPANLFTPDPGPAADHPGVEVADYKVLYAEDVVNRMVAIVETDIAGLGEVRTSGVIVVSERRDIWTRAVSKQRLAGTGEASIHLGGVGWRETVHVDREAWRVVGNGSVYQVWLEAPTERVHGFASPPRESDVRVANRTVTISIEDKRFAVTVRSVDDGAGETAPLPTTNESVALAGLTIENDEDVLHVVDDGTRVRVAERAD